MTPVSSTDEFQPHFVDVSTTDMLLNCLEYLGAFYMRNQTLTVVVDLLSIAGLQLVNRDVM